MSEALDYLLKVRPDAMTHYFAFLKDAGKHLDPKTRALISVITKVHAQTERGFKQYLKRALVEGCTPAEVIDALLMAFPALGLTRVVWAVDVILAMKLPGFDPLALTAAADWHDLVAVDDVVPGATVRVERDGRGVFVHRASDAAGDEAWQVFDSRCPHQGTTMPELALSGHTLTCPKHGWRFDVRTGACTAEGTTPLRRLDTRLAQGRVWARW